MVDLTIITPSLNHGAYVAEAIGSVARSDGGTIQHIVIDGGSTDATVAMLEPFLSRITFVSRPGLGSHEAINLAMDMARGQIVGFLNADDYYEPGALDLVIETFRTHPDAEALCGGMRFFESAANGMSTTTLRGHLDPPDLLLELTLGAPGFNSWFFRRTCLEETFPLDADLNFSADRDFLLKIFWRTTPLIVRELLYHYRIHEGSRTLRPDRSTRRAIACEHMNVARRHIALHPPNSPAARLLAAWWCLEWARCLAAGGVCAIRPPFPPFAALPRAIRARRRMMRLFDAQSPRQRRHPRS
ncbi:MAG: glycosyltransferase [Rhodospirillaceae bacterium]|nr:glycosyltransferase [Rhodospirillaceae bacterium]